MNGGTCLGWKMLGGWLLSGGGGMSGYQKSIFVY